MSVSFIHTGDLHLGRQFHFDQHTDTYGRDKRLDLWEIFEKILNTAEHHRIELLLISGDLFDSSEVDLMEVQRVADRLGNLERTKVVMIAGNHDAYNDYSLFGLVDWSDNVNLFTEDTLQSVYFEDLNTEVFGMSWNRRGYNSLPFATPVEINPSRTNILMLHGDAFSKQSDYMPIDLEKFNNFDYVALGHIHKTERLSDRMAYCGSPEALNFGESGEHGLIFGAIDGHRCQFQFVPTQKRRYINRRLSISADMSLDEVKEAILKCDSESERQKNYYRIYLEGYRDPALPIAWLRDEINREFYYCEIIDDDLQMDLDIHQLFQQNSSNLIGHYIREIEREDATPAAKKALYYGLEAIMKEKVIL